MPTSIRRTSVRSSARRLAAVAIAVTCLATGLARPDAARGAALEVPAPPNGAWVDASIALLDYNRERCDRLANKIVTYWRSLPPEQGQSGPGTPRSENQKRIRERVIKEWLAELTEARTASDIVTTFKPRALEAVEAETAVVLDRLHTLQERLCDHVAYPAGPMGDFVERVTDVLLQIDTESRQLALLLPRNDANLAHAIAPYLETLQLAGVEAEGEMLHFLESPVRTEQVLTNEALMAVWFERYRTAADPAKQSLRSYLAARDEGDRAGLEVHCRTLADHAGAILGLAGVFHLPEPNIERHLRRGYIHLQKLAASCIAGNFERADRAQQRAEHHFSVAVAYLEKFGYEP